MPKQQMAIIDTNKLDAIMRMLVGKQMPKGPGTSLKPHRMNTKYVGGKIQLIPKADSNSSKIKLLPNSTAPKKKNYI